MTDQILTVEELAAQLQASFGRIGEIPVAEADSVIQKNFGNMYISALTVHLVMYFGLKAYSADVLKAFLADFTVLAVEPSDVVWAFDHMVKNDFEDALQVSVALRTGCEVFYTFDRNLYAAYKHLPNLTIKLLG
jgi:predicted nucleic acid-binding protein